MLGLWGIGGIRCFLEGDCSLYFKGFDGGVTGRELSLILCGDFDLGGELKGMSTADLLQIAVLTIVVY